MGEQGEGLPVLDSDRAVFFSRVAIAATSILVIRSRPQRKGHRGVHVGHGDRTSRHRRRTPPSREGATNWEKADRSLLRQHFAGVWF